jgi:tRNA-splicing ligase RtcB
MPIKQTLRKGLVPAHIYTDDIQHEAFEQLLNTCA